MSLSTRCLLASILLAPIQSLHAGEIVPPGPAVPVHTLVAQLQGDYAGLPEQEDPRFGFSVALHGDTLAIGAPGTWVETPTIPTLMNDRGAVFIFRRHPDNDSWQLQQRLVFPSLNGSQCGHSVALGELSLLVGCPLHAGGRGRVEFYSRSNGNAPFENRVIFDDDSEQLGANCGASVALIDAAPGTGSPLPMAAVGCPNRRDFPPANIGLVGGVDIYRNFLGNWALATSLNGPATTATDFGRSVGLNRAGPSPGMTLLLAVGVPGTGAGNGSVRLYAMGDTVSDWTQEHMLTGPGAGSRFGHSVHMRAGRLAVGAPERRVANPLTNPPFQPTVTGSVSITTRVCLSQGACSWSQIVDEIVAPLLPLPLATAQNRMGHAVHVLTPGRVLAGAPLYPFGSFIGQARHYLLDEGEWVLNENEPFYPVVPAAATAESGTTVSGDAAWLAIGAPGYPDALGQGGRVFVYAYDYDDTIFRDDFEIPPK